MNDEQSILDKSILEQYESEIHNTLDAVMQRSRNEQDAFFESCTKAKNYKVLPSDESIDYSIDSISDMTGAFVQTIIDDDSIDLTSKIESTRKFMVSECSYFYSRVLDIVPDVADQICSIVDKENIVHVFITLIDKKDHHAEDIQSIMRSYINEIVKTAYQVAIESMPDSSIIYDIETNSFDQRDTHRVVRRIGIYAFRLLRGTSISLLLKRRI